MFDIAPKISNITTGSIFADDETCYEWWYNEKKLTIFYSLKHPGIYEYIKVWGPNIHSEMEDGTFSDSIGYINLLKWLYNIE